jgi:hypothetical protein
MYTLSQHLNPVCKNVFVNRYLLGTQFLTTAERPQMPSTMAPSSSTSPMFLSWIHERASVCAAQAHALVFDAWWNALTQPFTVRAQIIHVSFAIWAPLVPDACSVCHYSYAYARRPSCRALVAEASSQASLARLSQRLCATLAAAPVLFGHAFGQYHIEKTYDVMRYLQHFTFTKSHNCFQSHVSWTHGMHFNNWFMFPLAIPSCSYDTTFTFHSSLEAEFDNLIAIMLLCFTVAGASASTARCWHAGIQCTATLVRY